MIRRLSRPRPPLTIDQYVHRATLGLPRAERLDAATELRAHLLERVAEYQASGYAREEAEFLAVRGMGEVAQAHPQLWRERLTALGWPTLALLLVGGLGYTAYREWLPPREGVKLEATNSADMAQIFSITDAPRSSYQAATLTFPKGTRTLIYINVAQSVMKNTFGRDVWLMTKDIAGDTAENISGRIPGSYRYQERWLWTTQKIVCNGQQRARLWVTAQTMRSPFWNRSSSYQSGLGSSVGDCNNPSIALYLSHTLANNTDGNGLPITTPLYDSGLAIGGQIQPLPLGKWTVLTRIQSVPEGATFNSPKARGAYIAVLPLDYDLHTESTFTTSYGPKGEVSVNGKALPTLPPLIPTGN